MTEQQNNGQISIDLAAIREGGIYVMVPAYGGQAFAAFSRSLMQLAVLCTQHSIPFETFFIYNESLIPRARNYCADEFLRRKFRLQYEDGRIEEKHFKYGMFIDADIEFNAIDILVMAHFMTKNPEYNVMCGAYAKKQIAYEKLKEAVDKGLADEDPEELANYIGDYVFNSVDNKPIMINQPAEIMEGGTGFMMFRRETLLNVKEAFPEASYLPDHMRTDNFDGSREVHAYFDTSIDPETRRYLSEDYHFCKLVRKAGMKIWLIPWFELKHHGYFVFGGSLPKIAAAGLSATTDLSKIKKKKK